MRFLKFTFLLLFFHSVTFAQKGQIITFCDSDLPARWHQLILEIVEQSTGNTPCVAARNFAYINLAFYETILPTAPQYQSLAGQLKEYSAENDMRKQLFSENYYAPAAANRALFSMTEKMFANAPFVWMEKVYALRDSVDALHAKVVPEDILEISKDYGEKIADLVYEYSKSDGGHQSFISSYDMAYKIPQCEACFKINRVADLENTGPLHPTWGRNRTFIKNNDSTFFIEPKVKFSIYPNSAFYQQALEVYNTSKEVVPNSPKMLVANFWDDAGTFSYTAPGHSMSILSQYLKANPKSLEEAAEVYCKLSIALNDAFIVCWRTKFKYNTIRPITYIKKYIDSAWEPALLTPPFPEFPSGHSVQSATMATILTSQFGENQKYTDFSKYFVGKPRTFNSFWESANETSISRLYGGIHFKDALTQGQNMGKIIGENVLKMQFKVQ